MAAELNIKVTYTPLHRGVSLEGLVDDEIAARLTMSRSCTFYGYEAWYIGDLYLYPGHRRKGYGTKMVKKALEAGAAEGVDVFTLRAEGYDFTGITPEQRHAFWESCGFIYDEATGLHHNSYIPRRNNDDS